MDSASSDASLPTWLREVDVALAANPQVVLTGNLRDLVLVPNRGADGPPFWSLNTTSALLETLRTAGHQTVVTLIPPRDWASWPNKRTSGQRWSATPRRSPAPRRR